MKVPRLLTLVLSLSLFGTAGAVASSLWGDYEGFAKARVLINDAEQSFSENEAPAFLIKGSTVFPVRVLSDSLQALVKWDDANKTVAIYKPNVHMFVAKKISNDYSIEQPFGKVKKGDSLEFAVVAQVDSLTTPITAFKLSIVSPSGEEVQVHEKPVVGQRESFWYTWPFDVAFEEAGSYKVKFAIQTDEGGAYTVVSEKTIASE
ncbi:stalk domain-containing protein [Paenibacillus mucilaginosus]|uniref:Copper amine oxidase-like N-terminal domain-containing protein n=3 Tax=Paenibacillus mucilaginosus TaxID=61624 RepID=H6NB73_9BACL|nr:stalk domain-containing protein [Paenibacillus mucilaginosus]AEI42499.1 hypothetical protein KNP414_03961 [Paenibacillus mucilaginosus KNP414]AFC32041.1 hypothetical protein PM3016_5338 [Paenibacillus mucilaginosus 3016]AFH64411.1 hypothetical protein B2K_27585 [Paenibacillus mucilaginosus K02]AFK65212.1 hypothetical protein [Paenibacillus mucilaginosus K02]MCG7213893.1 copper amine oxidase N-terminal domain-containing protein [Paenibacillus mucilaginosus]